MDAESGRQVEKEYRKYEIVKAERMRQEVDTRNQMMHSEMSEWWLLEKNI